MNGHLYKILKPTWLEVIGYSFSSLLIIVAMLIPTILDRVQSDTNYGNTLSDTLSNSIDGLVDTLSEIAGADVATTFGFMALIGFGIYMAFYIFGRELSDLSDDIANIKYTKNHSGFGRDAILKHLTRIWFAATLVMFLIVYVSGIFTVLVDQAKEAVISPGLETIGYAFVAVLLNAMCLFVIAILMRLTLLRTRVFSS